MCACETEALDSRDATLPSTGDVYVKESTLLFRRASVFSLRKHASSTSEVWDCLLMAAERTTSLGGLGSELSRLSPALDE